MMQPARTIDKVRAVALERIAESRIAGKDTRHSRATNLHAIQELVNGHPHYTFGIRGVERFKQREVLDAIADLTKCSNDPGYTEGGGYISPASALKGLELGANAIASVARSGGRFMLGTGHPGSLLVFYIDLAKLIRKWGGEVIQVGGGAFVPPNLDLDYVEGVAVVSDRCSLWHSHDTAPMEIILNSAGPIDLAVTDHGFAGAAINAGVPVVGIMDTNDPALAVAKRMGADVIVIPMDDNRPLYAYRSAVEIIRDFALLGTRQMAADGGNKVKRSRAPRWVDGGSRLRPEVVDHLQEAESLVKQRLGPKRPLDEMVEDYLEGFEEQFVQTHFDMEQENDLINDPYVTLAIYGQVREAVDRFIRSEIRERGLDLTDDELSFYLRRSSD
ncbi:MAG: phosphatase [Chloroflexi bacterium]|nr:phosphatase [Chloroflexota bacterium]